MLSPEIATAGLVDDVVQDGPPKKSCADHLKTPPAVTQSRKIKVARMLARDKMRPEDIAAKLGWSVGTIYKDRKQFLEAIAIRLNREAGLLLAEMDDDLQTAIGEAWAAWEKSKQPEETSTSERSTPTFERVGPDGNSTEIKVLAGRKSARLTKRTTYGDVSILALIAGIVERRAKLHQVGGYARQDDVPVANPNGNRVTIYIPDNGREPGKVVEIQEGTGTPPSRPNAASIQPGPCLVPGDSSHVAQPTAQPKTIANPTEGDEPEETSSTPVVDQYTVTLPARRDA